MKKAEKIKLIKKVISVVKMTDAVVDKCKGYAPGCPICKNHLLVGLLHDYLDILEY